MLINFTNRICLLDILLEGNMFGAFFTKELKYARATR
jgi:hypothetical protein